MGGYFPAKTTPIALSIAGSDSGGGAGIQADLKTFSALGVYGASVVTAVTAQNTKTVSGVHGLPAEFVALQIQTVLEDLQVSSVKTGMLLNAAIAGAVAGVLRKASIANLVVDPVMVSKGGAPLLDEHAVGVVVSELFPISTVITPNLHEASAILDWPLAKVTQYPREAVAELLRYGSRWVLLKGGHGGGELSEDLLSDGTTLETLSAPRFDTENTHGTGCTLASAIAAFLARGCALPEAVRLAKSYVTDAIRHSGELSVGSGRGPVHHFTRLWSGLLD